jgi:hypothetical protein
MQTHTDLIEKSRDDEGEKGDEEGGDKGREEGLLALVVVEVTRESRNLCSM